MPTRPRSVAEQVPLGYRPARRTPCDLVGRGALTPPRLPPHFRMLTAACGQAALQHHRRPSLELAGRRKRRPLQRLLNALGLIVGGDAHIAPPSIEPLSYVDGPMWASAPTNSAETSCNVVGADTPRVLAPFHFAGVLSARRSTAAPQQKKFPRCCIFPCNNGGFSFY